MKFIATPAKRIKSELNLSDRRSRDRVDKGIFPPMTSLDNYLVLQHGIGLMNLSIFNREFSWCWGTYCRVALWWSPSVWLRGNSQLSCSEALQTFGFSVTGASTGLSCRFIKFSLLISDGPNLQAGRHNAQFTFSADSSTNLCQKFVWHLKENKWNYHMPSL